LRHFVWGSWETRGTRQGAQFGLNGEFDPGSG
jgi:hypothetical protein